MDVPDSAIPSAGLKPKGQELLVEVEGGLLLVAIGVETLAFSAEHSPGFEEMAYPDGEFDKPPKLKVSDPDTFAQSVLTELRDEEEDGTTLVHRMLDKAAINAVENGREGLWSDDDPEVGGGLCIPSESTPVDRGLVFAAVFNARAKEAYETAKSKGWWDEPREDGTLLCLMHSELSEALEALRHGNPPDDKVPEFSGVEAELADVVIRILDYAGARGLDVGGAIVAKMAMNRGREHRHGGKEF